jgi:hypothetical protein
MTYRRLPGKRRTLGGNSTLWLGDDHLLLVKSTRVAEEYRRFYFRDIQAFVIRVKKSSLNRDMFHVFLFLLLAVLFLYWTKSYVTFAVGAAALLYKRFTGPYCVCHIQTAVQTQTLPSLYRLKTAEQVLGELAPRIEAAQAQSSKVEENQPSEPSAQAS